MMQSKEWKKGDRVRVRYTGTGDHPDLKDTPGTFIQWWGYDGCLVEVDSRAKGNMTFVHLSYVTEWTGDEDMEKMDHRSAQALVLTIAAATSQESTLWAQPKNLGKYFSQVLRGIESEQGPQEEAKPEKDKNLMTAFVRGELQDMKARGRVVCFGEIEELKPGDILLRRGIFTRTVFVHQVQSVIGSTITLELIATQ